MNIDKNKLGYRKSTVAVVVDKLDKILVVQKNSYKDNEWDFPGGGVEENEIEDMAVLRELAEELGTDKFKLITKSQIVDQYEWPNEVIENKLKEKGRTWRGQRRCQYLVKFLGLPKEIRPQEEEIRRVKWVNIDQLPELFVFPNQFAKAEKLLGEFGLKG